MHGAGAEEGCTRLLGPVVAHTRRLVSLRDCACARDASLSSTAGPHTAVLSLVAVVVSDFCAGGRARFFREDVAAASERAKPAPCSAHASRQAALVEQHFQEADARTAGARHQGDERRGAHTRHSMRAFTWHATQPQPEQMEELFGSPVDTSGGPSNSTAVSGSSSNFRAEALDALQATSPQPRRDHHVDAPPAASSATEHTAPREVPPRAVASAETEHANAASALRGTIGRCADELTQAGSRPGESAAPETPAQAPRPTPKFPLRQICSTSTGARVLRRVSPSAPGHWPRSRARAPDAA